MDCTYREVIPDTNHFASPVKEVHPFFLRVTRPTAHFNKLVGQQNPQQMPEAVPVVTPAFLAPPLKLTFML